MLLETVGAKKSGYDIKDSHLKISMYVYCLMYVCHPNGVLTVYHWPKIKVGIQRMRAVIHGSVVV